MALILDTETNGLPNSPCYGMYPLYTNLKHYRNARIVQISFILTDSEFRKLEESDTIIKSDGFSIDNTEFHGITNEISQTKGTPFTEWANMFNNSLDYVDYIIAHNIDFDINVLKSELYRYNLLDIIDKLEQKRIICTMKGTKSIVKATFKRPNIKTGALDIKDPSLKELYFFATGKEIQNQHNSLHDIINLLECINSPKVKPTMLTLTFGRM